MKTLSAWARMAATISSRHCAKTAPAHCQTMNLPRLFNGGLSIVLILFTLQFPLYGAFTASTQWNVQSTATAADVNGGGFDTGVSGFPTDGAATVATSSAPIFTSASYNFVAGDVGAWIYIGAGTNWTQGWYKIASVASNAATLSAAIGAATLASGGNATGLSTAAGCATTASPTGATWGIDYSQQDAAQIPFTDMVIGVTTTTFTSVLKPVGKNFVGNIINVTSGTGFTVQRVAVVSTSGTVATCDKSLGTTASTGGNGNLGGSLLTIATANGLTVASNTMHIKAGTYTHTAVVTIAVSTVSWVGYNTAHYDGGTKPLITTATNNTVLINTGTSNGGTQIFQNLSLSNTAGTRASGIWQLTQGTTQYWIFNDCVFDGFIRGIDSSNGTPADVGFIRINRCEIKNCTTYGFDSNSSGISSLQIRGSYFHGNAVHVNTGGSSPRASIIRSIFAGSTGAALVLNNPFVEVEECTIANNTGGAVLLSSGATTFSLQNNIIYGNGSAITGAVNNAFTASAAAGRNNAFGSTGVNTNWKGSPGDITLTANPFTNSGTGDYSLNATTGGGALLKQAGYPGVFPGGTSTGYLDIGAVQTSGAPGTGGVAGGAFVQ